MPAMLMIRLQRVGRKHEPAFRLVLTDRRNSTKSGKYLAMLGSYDPRKKNEQFDADAIKDWISKGAKLSVTAHNLLVANKIIEGKKINALPKKTVEKKEEPVAGEPAAPQAAAESAPEDTVPQAEAGAEETPAA